MRFSSHTLTVASLALVFAGAATAQEKKTAGPLEVRLIARRTVYPVSKAPGEGVCFVAIDAELKNITKDRVLIHTAPEPELTLLGPRAESVRRSIAGRFFVPQEMRVVFLPGEVRRVPLRTLKFRADRSQFQVQWLEAGDYTLHAACSYHILPPSGIAKGAPFLAKSTPLKLTIREGSVVDYWAKAFADKDIDVRRVALLSLRDLGPTSLPASKAVIGLLADKNADLRAEAIRTLESIGAKGKALAAPALLDSLRDSDKTVRAAAIQALAKVAPAEKAVGPALLPLLRDLDTDIRLAAAQAWHDMPYDGRSIEPGDTAALLAALKAENVAHVRHRMIAALCHHHQLEVLAALLPYLEGADKQARMQTLQTLSRLGGFPKRDPDEDARLGFPVKKAVADLIAAMKDKDAHQAALYALARFGADAAPAVPALMEALGAPSNQSQDSLYHSRTRIVMALRDIGPPARAATRLLGQRMLTDSDWSTRMYSVQALASIGGDPRTLGAALNQALKDPMVQVRNEVPRALVKIGAIDALLDGLNDENPETRVSIIQAMGQTKDHAKPFVPVLVKNLREDKDPRIRRAAAYSLWSLEAFVAVPDLAKALDDADDSVRWITLDTLQRFGPKAKAAVPALIDLLKTSKNTKHREKACWALWSINIKGHKELVPIVVEMLAEKDAELVLPAIYLAGQIGPDAAPARDHLRRLSQRKDPHGSAARRALGQIEAGR